MCVQDINYSVESQAVDTGKIHPSPMYTYMCVQDINYSVESQAVDTGKIHPSPMNTCVFKTSITV